MKYPLAIFFNLWKLYVITIFTITGVLLFPVIRILLIKEKWHKKIHPLFVIWSWSIRILTFYHVKKVKTSPIPNEPCIVIANHSSYLDIFFMTSIIPNNPLLFLGKSELLKYPILGTYFRKLHIPVFRKDKIKSARSFIQAKKAVQKGWSLMIFPEGGIPNENLPNMVPFKDGAFKLAKTIQIPIVPITFTNNYILFSDPEHFLRRAHPGISKVFIHPTIDKETIMSLSEQELLQKCFDIIQEPFLSDSRL